MITDPMTPVPKYVFDELVDSINWLAYLNLALAQSITTGSIMPEVNEALEHLELSDAQPDVGAESGPAIAQIMTVVRAKIGKVG